MPFRPCFWLFSGEWDRESEAHGGKWPRTPDDLDTIPLELGIDLFLKDLWQTRPLQCGKLGYKGPRTLGAEHGGQWLVTLGLS